MIADIRKRPFWYLTFKDILTILCAVAVPIALGVYTVITYKQEQQQADRTRQFEYKQASESRQQTLYDEFLNHIYDLDKDGYLNESENPWAFANAFYRATHRQWDTVRKGDILQFLKEKELIGKSKCTEKCNSEKSVDIIRLNELNFDNIHLTSQTGTLNRLNLECVSFDQVSMANAAISSTNLNGVSFDGGRLANAKFDDTSLVCASFNGTDLQGTNFGNANLAGAHFSNVDLSTSILTEDQINQATFFNTTMPNGTASHQGTTKKKLITTATTTIPSTTVTTTTMTELAFHRGVQLNLNPSSLPRGWSHCYTAPYGTKMNSSVVASTLAICNQKKLLLGCRPIGSTTLTVAAMGNRTDVLYNCGSTKNCTREANGVAWYFSDSYSWGFANGGEAVYRQPCDSYSQNDTHRLCWHTSGADGGYRCGDMINLNSDMTWEKVIYQAN